jgi:translation initiation factor 5A
VRTRTGKAGEIRVGKFVMMEGEPWEVLGVRKEASIIGKEKVIAEAVGFVTGEKRTIEAYADEDLEFPIIEVKPAQILSIGSEEVTLLDLRNRSVFKVNLPKEGEVKEKLMINAEIDYVEIGGKRRILNVGLYDAHSYT